MNKKVNRSIRETRVLISGCLPPPMGGMATFYESLLASSLPNRIDLTFVKTSSQIRMFERSGRISGFNIVLALADCWRFTRALIASRPVIVHVGTAFGLSFVKHSVCILIARAFGCRVLLHPHCSYVVLYEDRSPMWKWYFRRVIQLVTGVVALSQEWSAVASAVPSCQVYTFPNAVPLPPYQEISRQRMGSHTPSRALHVLYLGHIGRAKGSSDLVEAARFVLQQEQRCEFRLVGGELSTGEVVVLHEKIKAAGLKAQVQICPPVTGPDKLAAYRWADVFVYPSYGEGMPMAVIEAMACGLPIIATKVGGLPDLVTHGLNGLLVDAGHPEQIAGAIRQLADEPSVRLSMGQQSYQRAIEDYDFENRVTQLVKIYSAVLTRN